MFNFFHAFFKIEIDVNEWDDLEEDERGLGFYYENPWEVKVLLVNSNESPNKQTKTLIYYYFI